MSMFCAFLHGLCFVHFSMAWFSWVFFCIRKTVQKQMRNLHYAQMFPNISIILEQICVFKTSVKAEMTITFTTVKYMYMYMLNMLTSTVNLLL